MRLSSCNLASCVIGEAPEAAAWQSGKNTGITGGVFWEPKSEVEVSLYRFIGEHFWNLEGKEREGSRIGHREKMSCDGTALAYPTGSSEDRWPLWADLHPGNGASPLCPTNQLVDACAWWPHRGLRTEGFLQQHSQWLHSRACGWCLTVSTIVDFGIS